MYLYCHWFQWLDIWPMIEYTTWKNSLLTSSPLCTTGQWAKFSRGLFDHWPNTQQQTLLGGNNMGKFIEEDPVELDKVSHAGVHTLPMFWISCTDYY